MTRSAITGRPCGSIRISPWPTTYLGIALLAKGRRDEVDEDYPVGVESLNQFRGSALREAHAITTGKPMTSTPTGSQRGTASESPRRTTPDSTRRSTTIGRPSGSNRGGFVSTGLSARLS